MPLEALEVVRWRADAPWVRVMIMVMMTMGRLLRTTSDRCRTSAIPVYSPPVVQRKGDLCGCNYCIRVQCDLTWKQGDSLRGEGGAKMGWRTEAEMKERIGLTDGMRTDERMH